MNALVSAKLIFLITSLNSFSLTVSKKSKGAIVEVNLEELVTTSVAEIGNDMTSDQKEKAQEVVVPVIIASQIVAQAGALMTRRF